LTSRGGGSRSEKGPRGFFFRKGEKNEAGKIAKTGGEKGPKTQRGGQFWSGHGAQQKRDWSFPKKQCGTSIYRGVTLLWENSAPEKKGKGELGGKQRTKGGGGWPKQLKRRWRKKAFLATNEVRPKYAKATGFCLRGEKKKKRKKGVGEKRNFWGSRNQKRDRASKPTGNPACNRKSNKRGREPEKEKLRTRKEDKNGRANVLPKGGAAVQKGGWHLAKKVPGGGGG